MRRAVLLSVLLAACGDGGTAPGDGGESSTGPLTGVGGAGATGAGSVGGQAQGGAPQGGAGQGGAPSFVLTVHTEEAQGSLVLRTSLPMAPAACTAAGAGALCDDLDADGIADGWEDIALSRLRPFAVLDEDESIVDDPQGVTGIVGRVARAGPLLHVFMMLGYSKDYGSCGFTSHNGDSERVALELSPLAGDGPGDARVTAFYTAAHEGTSNDHGHVYRDAEISMLVFATDPDTSEPRWTVFPSQDKHGTYASIDICENISSIPCFDEDCGPDGVSPADFTLLMPYVNAGEEDHPLVTSLAVMGFSGDDAWAMQDFCGGLGGSGCSSPVRDKLLVSPF